MKRGKMGTNWVVFSCFIYFLARATAMPGVMPGGVTKLKPDSIDKLTQTVTNLINENLDDPNSYSKVLEITDATSQVVAGMKYSVTFLKEQYSSCPQGGEDLSNCKYEGTFRCDVVFVVQEWLLRGSPYITSDPNCKQVEQSPQNENVVVQKQAATKIILGGDDHDYGTFPAFQAFMEKFNKTYGSDSETLFRWQVFKNNTLKIKMLNENEQGDAKYAINHFADLTEEEFRRYYLTPIWDTSYDPTMPMAKIPIAQAPDSFDWREHNAVTEVKNQGMCGSCWAFSTTGNIEGQWAIKNQTLVDLSEQELVDCDTLDDGCNGGLPTNAYQSIIKLGGLETEKAYPYEGKNDKCTMKKSARKIDINSYVNISSNEDDMKVWLFKNGPISIGINAFAMQFYFGGVSHPFKFLCNPDSLDHGVLIVGYGIKKGMIFGDTPYWIIKNSWGEHWGEQGYYLLYRGSGVCGVNKMPTSAVIN